MSETVLVSAATVAAAASCAVEALPVPGGTERVAFRVACDQPHTIRFYGAEADFSDVANAALFVDETETYVSSTAGTNGALWTIDPGPRPWVACVVTNDGSASATVTVAGEALA